MVARSRAAYYRSSWWRSRRLRYFRRHPRRCVVCGSTKRIQVHHLTYVRVYREWDSDLRAVCRPHHRQAHRAVRAGKCTLADSVAYITARHRRRRVA